MGAGISKKPTKTIQAEDNSSKYGRIFIKTDRTKYYPGQSVSGEIYISPSQKYPGRELFLRFSGFEAINIDFEMPVRVTPYYNQKSIVDKKSCIYTWDSPLSGQYTIPFTFTIPEDIPPSFHQEGRTFSAHVTYKIEVFVQPDILSEPPLKYEQKLIIRQPIKKISQSYSNEVTVPVKKYLCCSKGVSNLKVHFENSFYHQGQTVRAVMELDNSNNELEVQDVVFALKQRLRIGTRYNWVIYTIPKAAQILPGVAAKSPKYTSALTLRIPYFLGDEHDFDKRGKFWPGGLSDDSFGSLSLVTRSKLITSELYLEVACRAKGYKKNISKIVCPVEICYPKPRAQALKFTQSWNPQILSSVNIVFDASSKDGRQEQRTEREENQMIETQLPPRSKSQVFPEIIL